MAAMGYVYLVRHSIFREEGAYAILIDILTRLRRPGEAFDATLLLIADWHDTAAQPVIGTMDQPDIDLSASRFFTDMINAVMDRTPIREHREVRLRR